MIIIIAVSLILTGAISIYLNYSSTNQTLEQTMTETAALAADRVSHELKEYMNVATDTGRDARLSDSGLSISEKQAIMQQVITTYNFKRGNLLNTNGISLIDGKDYSERSYFQKSIKGESYISEPIVSKITNELSLMVSAPIWKDGVVNSEITGVVYFVPSETFLNDIMKTIYVSENGRAYILNSSGTVIAHLEEERVKQQENVLNLAKTDKSFESLAKIQELMIQQKNGFGYYTLNGQKTMTSYAPIDASDGWSLGISAPESDFMGATYTGIFITVAILIAVLIITFILSLKLANGIGKPIKACAERIELLSKGDLTAPVPNIKTKDETGQLAAATNTIVTNINGIIKDISWGLNELSNGNFVVTSEAEELYVGDFKQMAVSMYQIIDKLTNTLHQINRAAEQVASGSDQVSSGAQALSQGATEQASSVEELAATINEVSSHVHQNAENAQSASKQVVSVGEGLELSNQQMNQMIEAMDDINKRSAEIGKIIKTIEDIAFQTNILALNAAVEAARAGASGKGFAVVADEVRNLAAKSAEASKNTSELIVKSMDAVKNGTQIVNDTAQSLSDAVNGSKEVVSSIMEISTASEEQAQSIGQITQGIDQISSVIQTNSATAEESAAASEELSSQAQLLKDLIGQFKLNPEEI